MLNHPDYVITTVVFPYESEDYAARVTFRHRRTGKKSETTFIGREQYFEMQQQTVRQIKTRDYVTCTREAKPKKVVVEPKPIIGKGKGKPVKKKG